METCSLARGSKRKRKKSNQKDTTHCLSDFPDAILCHILSFLSTKTVVKTSVLSKRWQFIWTSLPSLDFKEQRPRTDEEKRNKFMNFVERVLLFHNAPRIEKFSLSCYLDDDAFRIKTWISTAVRRNAREFDISFHDYSDVDGQHVFPRCLFSCETTEVLKLGANYSLLLPSESQICLPCLRKLTLKRVVFKDFHELNLLFGSSTLEELVLDNCEWEKDTPHQLVISAPRLQSLTIYDLYDRDWSDEAASNRVTISSPVLRIFYYEGLCIRDLRFSCPSSIGKASLYFEEYMGLSDIHFDHFDEVLRSLRFVKYLKLSAFAIAKGTSRATVPIFENLSSLKIASSYEVKLSCKGLQMFLSKCPHLKSLELYEGIFKDFRIDSLLTPAFTCLSSLKNLTIKIHGEDTKELLAVHTLLAKAISLETMEITLSEMDESDFATTRKEIETFLCAIPRGSKSCKLTIKYSDDRVDASSDDG